MRGRWNSKISSGEEVVFQVNGREYVVHAKADGVSKGVTIVGLARDLINQDTVLLSDSPNSKLMIIELMCVQQFAA